MSVPAITREEVETFQRCMSVGGIALLPTDTIYGLACDATDRGAAERLYELKGRPPAKPSAVMFFSLNSAFRTLTELEPRTKSALAALLPGPVSVLLPNPAKRFPLACVGDLTTLGLRVPMFSGELKQLNAVEHPVLQSSANFAGGDDASVVGEVPLEIRREVEMILDAGQLPGTASSVVDLRNFERDASFEVLRPGAVSAREIEFKLKAVA